MVFPFELTDGNSKAQNYRKGNRQHLLFAKDTGIVEDLFMNKGPTKATHDIHKCVKKKCSTTS